MFKQLCNHYVTIIVTSVAIAFFVVAHTHSCTDCLTASQFTTPLLIWIVWYRSEKWCATCVHAYIGVRQLLRLLRKIINHYYYYCCSTCNRLLSYHHASPPPLPPPPPLLLLLLLLSSSSSPTSFLFLLSYFFSLPPPPFLLLLSSSSSPPLLLLSTSSPSPLLLLSSSSFPSSSILCAFCTTGELKLNYLKKPYLVTMTTFQVLVMTAYEETDTHTLRWPVTCTTCVHCSYLKLIPWVAIEVLHRDILKSISQYHNEYIWHWE